MAELAAASMMKGSEADPLIGRVINDRYKILAFVARGGMGKVYRAEQSALGRICALKVLHPSYSGDHDPAFHKRFSLEASLTSKLRHPNTVTIFDYGCTDDSIYYIAMEYLEGHTLHRAIRQVGHFPEERAAHIARQICRSLREAHSLGVIHRDLKPANVYLLEHGDEQDFVKVLDFGLVKNVSETAEELTQAGLFMGSPKYMAPEQVTRGEITAQTDIYALGIILYEMMTGKVPFDRPTSLEILMAHANDPAPSMHTMNPAAKISPAMEEAIARCMAKSPQDRFRSMDEVLAAVKRLGADHAAEPSHSTVMGGVMGGDRPSVGSGPQASSVISVPGTGLPPAPPSLDEKGMSALSPSGSPAVPQLAARAPEKRPMSLVAWAAIGLAIAGVAYAKLRSPQPSKTPSTAVAAATSTPAPATVATTPPGASAASIASTASAASAPSAGPPAKPVTEVDVSALAPAASTVAGKPGLPAVPAAPQRARGVPPPVVAPARPATSTSAQAKPAADCNPSYYYDADGNKHFKPECFGR